jgi:hypothetical protein
MDRVTDNLPSGRRLRPEQIRRVAIALREPADASGSATFARWRAMASQTSSTFALDLIEVALEVLDVPAFALQTLDDTLHEGNSVYEVRDDGLGLEFRVAPGVTDAVSSAVDGATGSAGDHLATAWNAAYGRTADPVKAYSEAIKATEAALTPRISPNDTKATLGKLITAVAAKPEKWTFVLGDDRVGVVLGMMQALWGGQTSRHGGTAPTRHETIEEARSAVHIAATLVQFGTSGALAIAAK